MDAPALPVSFRLFVLICFATVPERSVAMEVMEQMFPCCDLPQIHLDHGEHELTVNSTVKARVTEDFVDVRWPFKMEGRTLKLMECVDFSYKKDTSLQDGFLSESITHFHSRPCDLSSDLSGDPRPSSAPPHGFSSGFSWRLLWTLLMLGFFLLL